MTTQAPQSYRDVPVEQRQSAAPARYANVVLGIWLFLSAFIWPHYSSSQTNTWIVGLLIAAAGLIALRNTNVRFANTALAVWLAVSTLFFWPAVVATYWNNLIVAVFVFALSLVAGGGRNAPGTTGYGTTGRRI